MAKTRTPVSSNGSWAADDRGRGPPGQDEARTGGPGRKLPRRGLAALRVQSTREIGLSHSLAAARTAERGPFDIIIFAGGVAIRENAGAQAQSRAQSAARRLGDNRTDEAEARENSASCYFDPARIGQVADRHDGRRCSSARAHSSLHRGRCRAGRGYLRPEREVCDGFNVAASYLDDFVDIVAPIRVHSPVNTRS